jgi:PKD repeat protein
MNKKEISLLICLILLLSLTMGCLGDDGDKKKSNKAPICDLGPDLEVLSNTDIQFSSENCSDPDGEIVSYAWDFKDYRHLGAETSDEANPKYTYQWPGEFKATLTITDDDGKSAIDILNVTVLNRAPLASAGAPETVKVCEVVYLNGTAQDLDGYIIEYEWDFDGDGDYDWFASTTGMTTHFYDSPGNYKAILTVTDNLLEQTVVVKNITVIELHMEPPIADAGSDQVAPIGQVLLKGTGFDPDGNIELYEWDFDGDGIYDWSSSDGGIVNYGYTAEDIFIASLRVTDDSGLSATDIVTIEINNSILAQFIEAQIFINCK